VRDVAGGATRLFDGWVIVHPWAGKVSVALETSGCLLRDARLQSRLERVVRIVAIRALDRTITSFVVHRLGELGLNTRVALITKCGLRRFQQLPFFAGMDGVTVDATDVCFGMSGLREVGMLAGVTCQAMGIGIFCRDVGRVQDFGGVAVAVDVSLAIAVTAFAGHDRRFAVRGLREMLDDFGVAACAGV
jgi:hypothetical protein